MRGVKIGAGGRRKSNLPVSTALDAGMFAPDFFSLKFDDDLFQNLKIDIMKNEKMPHQF